MLGLLSSKQTLRMKVSVVIISLLAAFTSPAVAATSDTGIITAEATVTKNCSISDVTIAMKPDGTQWLKGTGKMSYSQTGTTKWTLESTQVRSGSGFRATISWKLGNNSQMRSISGGGGTVTQTITGSHSGKADVTAEWYAADISGQFATGTYKTETTVQCVVQ